MLDDIKKNKYKTAFIISGFIIMITLILYYICLAFNISGPVAIFVALLFSILSCFASYYNSDKIILRVSKARPATLEEDTKLVHVFESIMISSGLPCQPKLYVVDDPQPNAFATGRNPQNSIICVTTGLLEKLDRYELEAVIAHEMGHIRNYDILLSAVVTVMVGFVVMLSDMFTRICFHSSHSSSDNDDNKGSAILMIVGLVFLILGPIFAHIMQMAISRRREFLADATSAEITRNPQGLISALRKLDADPNTLHSVNSATAHLYIVNPLKEVNGKKKKAGLFDTHPSIDERIEALEKLQ